MERGVSLDWSPSLSDEDLSSPMKLRPSHFNDVAMSRDLSLMTERGVSSDSSLPLLDCNLLLMRLRNPYDSTGAIMEALRARTAIFMNMLEVEY